MYSVYERQICILILGASDARTLECEIPKPLNLRRSLKIHLVYNYLFDFRHFFFITRGYEAQSAKTYINYIDAELPKTSYYWRRVNTCKRRRPTTNHYRLKNRSLSLHVAAFFVMKKKKYLKRYS